jgi:hypothetical protein
MAFECIVNCIVRCWLVGFVFEYSSWFNPWVVRCSIIHPWMLTLDFGALHAELGLLLLSESITPWPCTLDLQWSFSSRNACIWWVRLCAVVNLVLCLWPNMSLIHYISGLVWGWAGLTCIGAHCCCILWLLAMVADAPQVCLRLLRFGVHCVGMWCSLDAAVCLPETR